MRKWILASSFLFLFRAGIPAVPAEDIKTDLIEILNRQKAAWNSHDLEGYMAAYWRSPELTFHSGSHQIRGWDALFESYKKRYSGSGWGALDFADLEVNVLSNECACILGRWKVTNAENVREGVFTLLFKRYPEGWRIIHDHSS